MLKLSPPRTKILSAWVSWLHLGGQVWLSYGRPRWCHLGANFGVFGGCVDGHIIWDHFRPCCFDIAKSSPKIHRNAPPLPLKARQNQNQKPPQTQKLRQKAKLHGSKAKRHQKSSKIQLQNALPSGPAATTSFATAQIKGPLTELYEMTMFLRKLLARRQEPH